MALVVLLVLVLCEQAGLSIERNRVRAKNSSLAMTRTLGDTKYKQPELPPQQQVTASYTMKHSMGW